MVLLSPPQLKIDIPLLWYSDVTLEIKPVEFGYRPVLTHNPSELWTKLKQHVD
jgi:hypothetical protein